MPFPTSATDLPDYTEDDERAFREYLAQSCDDTEYGEDVEAELARFRSALTREKAHLSRSSISVHQWHRRTLRPPPRRFEDGVRVVHRLGTRSRTRRRTARHAPQSRAARTDSEGDPPHPRGARRANVDQHGFIPLTQSFFDQRNNSIGGTHPRPLHLTACEIEGWAVSKPAFDSAGLARRFLTTREAADHCGYRSTSALRKAKLEGRIRPAGQRGGTGTLMWVGGPDAFLIGRSPYSLPCGQPAGAR
jgi:hypothetical protein